MKHTFIKKSFAAICAAAACILPLEASSSFAAQNADSSEFSGASDPILYEKGSSGFFGASDPILYEKDGISVLYEDKNLTLGVIGESDTNLSADIVEYGEPVLTSINEYVEGDYRFVDKVYHTQVNSPSRSLKRDLITGKHEVYYEPDLGENSMHLATMEIEAVFYTNEAQHVAYVDEETINCKTTKLVNDFYPFILEDTPVYHSNIKIPGYDSICFASVEYTVDFVKAAGIFHTHEMTLVVGSNGKSEVQFKHYIHS